MKFYISGRVRKSASVKKLATELESRGHTVTFDWTSLGNLQPYTSHLKKSAMVSQRMLRAIKNSDVFVLITDRAGTGMYAELGFAIANNKKIYAVGRHLNTAIFFFNPKVKRVNSVGDLLKRL